MLRRNRLLLLGLVLVCAQSAWAFVIEPDGVIPRGSLVRVYLHEREELSIRVSLVNAENDPVAAGEGMRLELENGSHGWVVLIGIPNWIARGPYRLLVERAGGSGTSSTVHAIEIGGDAYATYDLPLNAAMSSLRSDPSPQRVAESQALAELLWTVDRSAPLTADPFALPVRDARRSSHFGDRRRYLYSDGGTARAVHHGLDLAAPTGTPIMAPAGGRVVFAGTRIISGETVVLEHGPGIYSLFYHLDELGVSLGERVSQDDPVGTVGATGLVTGPHLHWEIRVFGTPIDPLDVISEQLVDKSRISAILGGSEQRR
jgi:murein DD-endopeptidase MepM/ murein hydrolase activator NlpD